MLLCEEVRARRREKWAEQKVRETKCVFVCMVRAATIFTPSFALQCFLEIDLKWKIVP